MAEERIKYCKCNVEGTKDCQPDGHGKNECICNSGWGGPLCEVNEDESWTEKIKEFCTKDQQICSDNGACAPELDGRWRCYCNEGWDGEYCGNEINPTNPYRCSAGGYYNEAQQKCLPCRKCEGALGGYEDPEFVAEMCDGSGNKNPNCKNRCPPNQYYKVIDEDEHTCHKCHYARDDNNEQVSGQEYCPTGHKVQPPDRRGVPGKAWRFVKCSGNTNRDVSSCAPTELYCDSEKCLPSWKMFDDIYPGSFKQPRISCPGAQYFDNRSQQQSGGKGIVGERGGWRGWFKGFSGNYPNIMDGRSKYEQDNIPFIKAKKGNLYWDDTYAFNEYVELEHDFLVPSTYFARCSLNWQNDAEPGTETQCYLQDWDGQGGSHLKRNCAAMGVDVNDIVTWPPGLTSDDDCNYHETAGNGKFKCCNGWRLEYNTNGKAEMKQC